MALIKRGYRPTILDTGVTPDAAASSLKVRMASTEPEAWASEDLEQIKQIGPPSQNGIPQKLAFGSDFAYRDLDTPTTPELKRASMRRSFAVGGFSNVWGAVIERFPSQEFDNWPIPASRLDDHYAAILDLMSAGVPFRHPSSQARALHTDMAAHRKELAAAGIRFEYSSLAVRSDCRSCGLCLYGCPYDSIFDAGTVLSRLVQQGLVCHVPGVVVDRLSAADSGVAIEGRSVQGNGVRVFSGKPVFIAAGLLETIRIVLNSTRAKLTSEMSVRIQTSDIFTVPMLRYRRSGGISAERLHTLCQMILDVDDRNVSEHPVHLQLYGYNDLYPSRACLRSVAERLFVAFGYLHSQVSSKVDVSRVNGQDKLTLTGRQNDEGRRVARLMVQKLFQNRRFLRMVPVLPQLQFDLPGGSVRNGACFPMRRNPEATETDVWGRMPDLENVHLVDASVLPAIPAGPIAFTVMANAHRIASECPIDDVQ